MPQHGSLLTMGRQSSRRQVVSQVTSTITVAAMEALIADMTIDVIEMAAGTYKGNATGWRGCDMSVNRAARPLTIRPAKGATVIFSCVGDGDFGDGPFRLFGVDAAHPGGYITFDGWPGLFRFEHTLLAQTGIFTLIDFTNVTIRNIQVRNCAGNANAGGEQSAHIVYASHGTVNLVCEDFDIAACRSTDEAGGVSSLNGLHVFTGGTNPAVNGVTARRWTVDRLNWASVLRNAASGVLLEDWAASNCGGGAVPAAADFGTDSTGTVRRYATTASVGTPHIQGLLVDGGGNSYA